MQDFPPVVWLTKRIEVPRCLQCEKIFYVDQKTGKDINARDLGLPDYLSTEQANVLAWHRLALGFPITSIEARPWPEHAGYRTQEGQELNESAREYGDDPDDWYVSDNPIDVLQATEVWLADSIVKPKLKRCDGYLKDIHRMVTLCRTKRAYIPPSWLTEQQARELAARVAPHVPIV